MVPIRFIQLLAMCALGGCAATQLGPRLTEECLRSAIDEEAVLQHLARAAPCCASVDEITFEPLQTAAQAHQGPYFVLIALESRVREFPSGRSRFAAFDMRTLASKPKSVLLIPGPAQYVNSSGATALVKSCSDPPPHMASRILRPVVTYLDGSRRPLVQAIRGQHAIRGIYPGWSFDVPEGAAFLLVHTDPTSYGDRIVLEGKSDTLLLPVPGAPLFLPTPISGSKSGISVSTGQLAMYFEP